MPCCVAFVRRITSEFIPDAGVPSWCTYEYSETENLFTPFILDVAGHPVDRPTCEAFCDFPGHHSEGPCAVQVSDVYPGCPGYCIYDDHFTQCQSEYAPTLGGLTLCGGQRCCIECSDGSYHCSGVDSQEFCEDLSNWGCGFGAHVTDAYLLPIGRCGSGEDNICGRPVPCCLPTGGCTVKTKRQCDALGGEVSGVCYETCGDAPNCCPPPVPCCQCGECTMVSQQTCQADAGTVAAPTSGQADCLNPLSVDDCRIRDEIARPCMAGTMLPSPTVRSGFDGYYDLHTIAPLPNIEPYIEPPKYYRGQVWDEAWMCHESHKRPQSKMIEKIGFALQDEDETLGGCVPPGYGAFMVAYRKACELPSQEPA